MQGLTIPYFNSYQSTKFVVLLCCMLNSIETVSTPKTTHSESNTGISNHSAISILTPINTKITAKPYFNKENLSPISAIKKYIARRPKMANKFDVKTIKGSVVKARTAGMLSTAKTISEISTNTNAKNNGVA